ncbi:MAG TPA: DUF2218 domain-containing protein [Kribbella sp.]|uniref:DUF2218 domain-containing protein n=1 Tax=Kribbella sp. TaxID=1871183 RepID=UPI002D77B478|nr:DUF2218 domain-containing protein [Kribbella sp.]HET6299356.1 DUF2218 domain-containing protein [Kribbella sp.]
MLTAEAHIQTEAPSRYLTQLCSHANSMNSQRHKLARLHKSGPQDRPQVRNVEWTETDGTLTLSIGRCILHAGAGTLTVRVEAADEQGLQQLQELVSRDLERFGNAGT